MRCVDFDLYEFIAKDNIKTWRSLGSYEFVVEDNKRTWRRFDQNGIETMKKSSEHVKYEEFVEMHMAHRHEDPYLHTFRITYKDALHTDSSELVRTRAAYVAESKPRVFS